VVAELPTLIGALTGQRGEITHVILNATERDLPHPRRTSVGRRVVQLGRFTSQPTGLITLICELGADRFDLLVVPSDTSRRVGRPQTLPTDAILPS
jgi:uncharacterized protein DUF5994